MELRYKIGRMNIDEKLNITGLGRVFCRGYGVQNGHGGERGWRLIK